MRTAGVSLTAFHFSKLQVLALNADSFWESSVANTW